MDTAIAEETMAWLRRRYGERADLVSRNEIVHDAEHSDLPEEVLTVLRGLPDDQWPFEELVPTVRDALASKVGRPA